MWKQYRRRIWTKRNVRCAQRESLAKPLIRQLEALVKGFQTSCTSSQKGESRWIMNCWIDMIHMTESDTILLRVSLPSGSLLSSSYQARFALKCVSLYSQHSV